MHPTPILKPTRAKKNKTKKKHHQHNPRPERRALPSTSPPFEKGIGTGVIDAKFYSWQIPANCNGLVCRFERCYDLACKKIHKNEKPKTSPEIQSIENAVYNGPAHHVGSAIGSSVRGGGGAPLGCAPRHGGAVRRPGPGPVHGNERDLRTLPFTGGLCGAGKRRL